MVVKRWWRWLEEWKTHVTEERKKRALNDKVFTALQESFPQLGGREFVLPTRFDGVTLSLWEQNAKELIPSSVSVEQIVSVISQAEKDFKISLSATFLRPLNGIVILRISSPDHTVYFKFSE